MGNLTDELGEESKKRYESILAQGKDIYFFNEPGKTIVVVLSREEAEKRSGVRPIKSLDRIIRVRDYILKELVEKDISYIQYRVDLSTQQPI